MNARIIRLAASPAPAPLAVLELRAWARAYLWAACLIETIPEAVDPLTEFAERSGLDPDTAQQILAHYFREAEQ
jgi:hypothetical protein